MYSYDHYASDTYEIIWETYDLRNVSICSSAERTPVSKHISAKETDTSARSSGTCPTPEFRMSVLLARDEHLGSQKELHNRSPAMRTKSVHLRDKSGLRTRDTLKLVNEKQPASLYEVYYFYVLKKLKGKGKNGLTILNKFA